MAVKDFLDSATALSHILEESYDDLHIVHEIDLSKITPSFKHFSPVHFLNKYYGLRVQTCVEKVSHDESYAISILILQSPVNYDVMWPVCVEWKLCVVADDKELYLDLQHNFVQFQKLDEERNEREINTELQITKVNIKDFTKDEKVCFGWTVKLNGKTISINNATPDYLFHKIDFKDHLKSLITKVQVLDETLNHAKHTEDLESIKKVISECENNDLKLENVKSAYQDINERVEILKKKFVKQQQNLDNFLTDWDYLRTETVKEDTTTNTLDLVNHPSSVRLLENESTSTASTASKHYKILLIGDRKSGKSATGNSILQKRVFESSGMNKEYSSRSAIQKITSFYSSDIQLTVVELEKCQKENIMAALESCEEGFDAILCVVKYGEKYANDIFVDNTSMKDDALKIFGIMLITGADSFQIDFPDRSLDDCVEEWIVKYQDLQTLVKKRVVVFDNSTTCYVKKAGQLKTLLQTIESLPGRPNRFNKDKFIKNGLKLYNHLEGLHILTDQGKILSIFVELIFFTKYSVDTRLQNVEAFFTSFLSYHRKYRIDERFEVFLIGKSSKALTSTKFCIENMKIKCIRSQDPKTDISKNIEKALLLVISCLNSSTGDDKQDWNILRANNLPLLKDCGILVLIDGNELFSKEEDIKIKDWCLQQTGLIKEMFEACSSRVVLVDYNTTETVEKLSQELELIQFIDEVLFDVINDWDLSPFSQNREEYFFRRSRKSFRKYERKLKHLESEMSHEKVITKVLPDSPVSSKFSDSKKSEILIDTESA